MLSIKFDPNMKQKLSLIAKTYQWLWNSLANQLLFTYLILITLALLTISFWALVSIKAESINDLRNSLEVEAVNLALEIDNDLAIDSIKSKMRIKSAVDRHASKLGVSITVVDRDGHVLADSDVMLKATNGENLSNQSEINEALAGIMSISTRNSPNTQSNWLYVAYPVRAIGQTTGVIRIGVQLTQIEQRLHQDLIVFLEITLATWIITICISLWLAQRVSKPIKDMSNLAKKIALSGDIAHIVPVNRHDEIGELGQSFNQMIKRLQAQEKLRQEFIANASHELKTPTMAISSVVEALLAGAKDEPELKDQFLNSLDRLVIRQSKLIQDLLDISQLDAETGIAWVDEVNLVDLLNESIEHIKSQSEKKSLVLKTEIVSLQNTQPIVPGKYNHLLRAINNILANAINYTSAGGNITLSGQFINIDDVNHVEIKIIDTGVGIEEKDLNHIFERFYRTDKARARASGGTGLGLAITYDIIHKHNGIIKVESNIGKGTTFTVILPIINIIKLGTTSAKEELHHV